MQMILKRNLTPNQRVFYFHKPSLTSDGLDFRGKKTKITELEFLEIKNHGGVYFLKVGTNNAKQKFYDGIKGLLYHTTDEAQQALDEHIIELKKQIIQNIAKTTVKLAERSATLTKELYCEAL